MIGTEGLRRPGLGPAWAALSPWPGRRETRSGSPRSSIRSERTVAEYLLAEVR